MMGLIKRLVCLAMWLPGCVPLWAVDLGAPFADNAILQRDMPVPVWGWSEPGTEITVTFAGQRKVATAGNKGKWMLALDPLKASAEPADLVVSESSGDTRTVANVLVGEVWLASGQSNMQWVASKSDVGRVLQKQIAERVAAGTEQEPVIREAKVTNYFAHLHPIEKAEGAWSTDVGDFSAIAYAFAYKLHQELGVPIGILNCSFSQTSIQAWTPRNGFAAGTDPYTQAIYQKILETDPTTAEHKAAWSAFYESIEATLAENAKRVARGEAAQAVQAKPPGNLSGNRDASWLFNARLHPMIPYALRGAIWNQGYANMGEGLPYYHNLHSMIRGWRDVWGRPELPVYFHQFYCPGQKGDWDHSPRIGGVADMRMGTWLARDIPNTGMASQIDITGAIHYGNKALPGQRLALHALKNQYGKAVVADGPMFKSYTVKGDQLVVTFEHAEGGLVVAETGTQSKDGMAVPTIVPQGASRLRGFYLADEHRVWHPAQCTVSGSSVVLTAPGVKTPRGVSYGTGGVGNQPNIYNRSLLPATPFIYYDHTLVTAASWAEESLEVAGVEVDPDAVGIKAEWVKMPLLSTQFRSHAVLQAGKPITFWGSVLHDHGTPAEGEAVVRFSFAGIEKDIPVVEGSPHIVDIGPGMSRGSSWKEWRFTVPAMEASAVPRTLKVAFLIDGEVAHERVCEGIVIGDVWYVAAPPGKLNAPAVEPAGVPVRMIQRKAKRFASPTPSRYSVCVSRTPLNRFASEWTEASGLAAALGHRFAAATGRPVGIIFMQSGDVDLKSWIPARALRGAPSLMDDYKNLAAVLPGNPYYDANVRAYMGAWKHYWGETIPQMMESRAVPDGAPWGSYPVLSGSVTSKAAEVYNVLVHSFTPATLKGVVFLAGPEMVADDKGAHFGEQLSVLANAWKSRFGDDQLPFVYTLPGKSLAPGITPPEGIAGPSLAVEVGDWSDCATLIESTLKHATP